MPKRKNSRAKKGTVSIGTRNGMIRLRWSYQGKSRQLSLGLPDTPLNRQAALAKAADIEADLRNGRYDSSLARYRMHPQSSPAKPVSTTALFEEFTEYKRSEGVSGQAIKAKYVALRSNIARLEKDIHSDQDAYELVELLRNRQSPRIANQNLTLLKAFGEWLASQQKCDRNFFADIKPLKNSTTSKVQNRKPFTVAEVQAILSALRTDPNRYRYYDFCYVMLSLGLRPSEAIGLRWRHVDLERQQITIHESLSRSGEGKSAGYARQRKLTKTKDERIFRLSEQLLSLFAGRKPPNAMPDDLVFATSSGKPIDDCSFRTRCWKPILEKAGVEYRPPYAMRHTFTSHGIEMMGWTTHQAARMLGHTSARLVENTYGHMIDQPELPKF